MSLRVPSLKSALIEESKEDEHGTPVYKIHGYWFKQTDVTDNPLGVVQQSIWLLQSYRNNFLAAEDKPPITELDPLNQKKVRSYSN